MANLTPLLLQNFDPSSIVAAQAAWGTASGNVASAGSGITSAQSGIAGWMGPASMAARSSLSDLGSLVQPVSTALHDGQYAVQSFIAGVLAAQNALNIALNQAYAIPADVDLNTGVVTAHPYNPPSLATEAGGSSGPIANPIDAELAAQENARRQAAAVKAQSDIHNAVMNAVAADQNSANDLLAGGAAAAQAQSFNLADPGPGGLPALNLGDLANAPAQFSNEVKLAQQLAQQTSQGNSQSAQSLAQYSYIFAHDHTFATAVMSAIGQPGLINLENALGLRNATQAAKGNGEESQANKDLQTALNNFFSAGFSSATANLQGPGDPGSASHLSGTWVSNLIKAAQTSSNVGVNPVSGFYGLGQALSGADGGTIYSEPVLSMLAPAFQTFEQDKNGGNNGNTPIGILDNASHYDSSSYQTTNYYGSSFHDPLAGFWNAAGSNPDWTRTYLQTGNNLSNQLAHNWNPTSKDDPNHYGGGDQGQALGAAVLNAGYIKPGMTAAQVQSATNLTDKFVTAYGNQLAATHNDNSYGAGLAGLRDTAGALLSQHTEDLNASYTDLGVDSGTGPTPAFGRIDGNLKYVIEQAGLSNAGYGALYGALNSDLQNEVKAGSSTGVTSSLLGFTAEAQSIGREGVATNQDLQAEDTNDEDNQSLLEASQIAGFALNEVPVVGGALNLGTLLAGDQTSPAPRFTHLASALQAAENVRTSVDNTHGVDPQGSIPSPNGTLPTGSQQGEHDADQFLDSQHVGIPEVSGNTPS